MHPWTRWIVLAALAAFAGQAAVVYKWTDADGVVHYSDQPVPGAEKIYTSASSAGTGSPARATPDIPAPGAQRAGPVLGYTDFSIASPQPDQTFFGDEVITVSLALSPELKQNHVLTWHLNGRELEDQGPNATQFRLPHLDRNTYVLTAIITDPQSGESRSTDSVTFFVRQPSALSPQHQRP
ncbi:MAG TPA: DUF4124 domain-containing protein [Steroidobacteraceae bacterium]|nr:DUF4124 domain-containing protein [Steroidobacteraceae bacterium]